MIYKAKELRHWNTDTENNGRWLPARPLTFPSFFERLRTAYFVFMRRYDALDWEDGGAK